MFDGGGERFKPRFVAQLPVRRGVQRVVGGDDVGKVPSLSLRRGVREGIDLFADDAGRVKERVRDVAECVEKCAEPLFFLFGKGAGQIGGKLRAPQDLRHGRSRKTGHLVQDEAVQIPAREVVQSAFSFLGAVVGFGLFGRGVSHSAQHDVSPSVVKAEVLDGVQDDEVGTREHDV